MGGNLVTWRSKKQSVVARSNAEAEYRAIALGLCELLWLKRLLGELKDYYKRSYEVVLSIVITKHLSTFLTTQSSMIEPNILKLIDISSKRS